jgi:hypothetical protein
MTPAARKYKQEAQSAVWEKERLERELKRMQEDKQKEKDKDKQRWDAIVYCENCQTVNSVLMPPGVLVSSISCIICKTPGTQHLVRSVNCERTK